MIKKTFIITTFFIAFNLAFFNITMSYAHVSTIIDWEQSFHYPKKPTPLTIATMQGDIKQMTVILNTLEGKEAINKTYEPQGSNYPGELYRHTNLFYAIMNNDLEAVNLLLIHGAKVNNKHLYIAVDNKYNTERTAKEKTKMLKLLQEYNVNMNPDVKVLPILP